MKTILAFAAALTVARAAPLQAASLEVTPVTLDVAAPGQSAIIHLRNLSEKPLPVQLRLFRWTQQNGVDRLVPTEKVVASPPAVTMAPGADYTARVVRLDRAPIRGEVAYRLFVDELPDPNRLRNGAVALVVRYSIPVFFTSPDASAPHLSWSVEREGRRRLALVARNDGARRLRIADLVLSDAAGRRVSFGRGLAGYVLGHSSKRFTARLGRSEFGAGALYVTAQSDLGPIHAGVDKH